MSPKNLSSIVVSWSMASLSQPSLSTPSPLPAPLYIISQLGITFQPSNSPLSILQATLSELHNRTSIEPGVAPPPQNQTQLAMSQGTNLTGRVISMARRMGDLQGLTKSQPDVVIQLR